jgi:hypothetical protein
LDEVRKSPERFRSPGRASKGSMFSTDSSKSKPMFGRVNTREELKREDSTTTRATMLFRETEVVDKL